MPYELAVGFQPDVTVFAFTLGCAAITGLLLGALPARRAARTDLMAVIREDATAQASGRARAALLVLQLALSFVLVAGTIGPRPQPRQRADGPSGARSRTAC